MAIKQCKYTDCMETFDVDVDVFIPTKNVFKANMDHKLLVGIVVSNKAQISSMTTTLPSTYL